MMISKFEHVRVSVGTSGSAVVHDGVKQDGQLLPFAQCGVRSNRVASETDAPLTCAKCIQRNA